MDVIGNVVPEQAAFQYESPRWSVSPARRIAALIGSSCAGAGALAVFDQGVVSGANFLTTILIGRWGSAHELGIYSLGFSLLVAWTCVQESLIATPYTIYWRRSVQDAPSEYAGSVLIHLGLLSTLSIVILAVVAALLRVAGKMPELTTMIGVLAAVIPFILLREFGRRFAFAHLHLIKAVGLDLAVAAMQLAALGGFAWYGALTATNSFIAIGAACALTGTIWLYVARRSFVIRGGHVRQTMAQSWGLGKWIFASQAALFIQGYISYWLLAGTVGTAATGVYTACMTIALFSNPLILGFSNILVPRAALAFAEGGGAKLRHDVVRDTLLLGAAMAVFCAVVLLGGEDLMRLLYHGRQYEGHGHTVTVLALAMLASAVGIPASNGLATMERPDAIFRTALFAVVLSVGLIWVMVAKWGVMGAAYGLLAGNLAGSVGRWAAFLALVPSCGMAKSAARSTFAAQQSARSSGGHRRAFLKRVVSGRTDASLGELGLSDETNNMGLPSRSQLADAEIAATTSAHIGMTNEG